MLFTKIATAATIGSNIITSKEPSTVEVLGEDYPYLTNFDFESVRKTVDYAKKTFRTETWKNALKKIEEVKKRTSINIIVENYIKMINSFK